MHEEQNLTVDVLVRATANEGNIRCMAAVTTNLVAEAAWRHQTAPTATAALGRTLTGTLLLGAGLKEFDRLTVQIICNGAIGGITAETNAQGHVRGYVNNPKADVPLNAKGKLDVRAIVGDGMFYVTNESGFDIGLYSEPYRGSVPVTSGEIAEDFAYYLAKSEQIPSAVVLGVLVRARGTGEKFVEAAGGLMLQVMPGADDEIIGSIEELVTHAPPATELIRAGATPVEMLRIVLGDLPFEMSEEKAVRFACTCSSERALSLISSIDRNELEAMLHEDEGAKMTCHFCNTTYVINKTMLEDILSVKP
ncbi:MAG: Hsp33 family molecular chaperone HslO [Pyrinomonadaceae bacterium]